MSNNVYESIMTGLQEAIEDSKKEKTLRKNIVSIIPVKEYNAEEIQEIRKSTGLSQRLFAGYIGVSIKTVEAWERGINHPSGAASRILTMMEMDSDLVTRFPFVQSMTR